MIRCLSEEVQAKLRSGVAIFSLQQCVEELILNSIDAGATCVGVRVDMDAYKVQVIDNGSGVGIEDMERIGNRYCTSKCSTLGDLDNLRFYGFRGEAVASIVSLARLVEISSRTKLSVKTHVKVFKDGKGLDVFEAETTRPSAGTTVTICSFFHNMPVRRKRMDAILECERIRQRVEAISLMHPSVSFTLKNDCTGAMVVQLSKARNTYYRFVQIHGLGRAQRLAEISHSHAQFKVTGYIGREGHYNNSLQFLYVNDRLLLKTRIQKLLNFLLRKVSSSNQKNDSPVTSSIRSPKQRRGPELHGVYVLNIECHYSEYDICLEPAKTLVEFRDWDGILFCVEEAVKAFLTRENLVVELSPDDMEYAGQSLISGHQAGVADGEVDCTGCGGKVPMEDVAQECSIGGTLASESVHRRVKKDSDTQDHDSQERADEIQGNKRGDGRESGAPTRTSCQEQEHRLVKTWCASRSVDTDGEAPQRDLITLTNESVSVPHENIIKEKELHNTPPQVDITGEESQSVGPLLAIAKRSEVEHLNVNKEESAEIKSDVSLSRSIGVGLFSVPQEQDTSCIKQTLPQRQKIRLQEQSTGGNRRICLSDLFVHEDVSKKCTALQRRPGLAMRCEENLATKRNYSFVESLGYGKVNEREYKDPSPAIPSKISKVLLCQKLALSKEAGSLDNFRSIYGKPTEIKPHPVDSNSNYSATDAIVLPTDHLVMTAKSVPGTKEEENESVVRELQLNRQNDHRSPITLSVFTTKLQSHSAQPKANGISLAAKLSHLKDQKSELPSSASVHPSGAPSKVDTCPADALGNITIQEINNQDDTSDIDNREQPTCVNPDLIPGCSSSPPLAEKENITASSDWLHHYDDLVGKLVYVNKVTGLSRYEDPTVEEAQVSCTSDVTNMAISVISKQGGETQTSNSLSSLYLEWNNPVFARPPTVGVNISSGQAEGLAVKIHNILFPYRFSKDMIHSMKVIHQVDKKFLACLIDTRDQECANGREDEGNLLVLVDQHAAHERVRLENLVADSYEDDPETPGERRLCSSTIAPPLEVTVTEEELRLLRSCQPFLRGLGLDMQFSQTGDARVGVRKVPVCFIEKESNELRRGRQSVIKPIVEEYLQEQIELLRSTGRVRGTLPLTVLKVLASLACHGAIKFNDSLNKDECCSLVASLSSCQLPFQCAHGRPSIAPLVDFLHLKNDQRELPKPNLRKLARMYKAWELYGHE